jgi:hypothetical protein
MGEARLRVMALWRVSQAGRKEVKRGHESVRRGQEKAADGDG